MSEIKTDMAFKFTKFDYKDKSTWPHDGLKCFLASNDGSDSISSRSPGILEYIREDVKKGEILSIWNCFQSGLRFHFNVNSDLYWAAYRLPCPPIK